MGLDMYLRTTEPFKDIEWSGEKTGDRFTDKVIINNPYRVNSSLSTMVQSIPAYYVNSITTIDGDKHSVWDILEIRDTELVIKVWDDTIHNTMDLVIVKSKIKEISYTCAYWRKANQIHNWFVENVQGGVDDCGEYEVTQDQMRELINLCKKVLKRRDNETSGELLPTQSGFFFGSTEYDDWYYSDIQDTIDQLEPLLNSSSTFFYHSSW